MSYPTKIITARVVCELGLFAVECVEHRADLPEASYKSAIAEQLAYRLKADKTQRLFRGMSESQVYAELLSERYAYKFFVNEVD